MSRNVYGGKLDFDYGVTPRERRVSRNNNNRGGIQQVVGHASREACE